MTGEELLRLFKGFRTSVFRLETLQHYAVEGDQERQRAFHQGRALPPPRPSKQAMLAWITESVRERKRIERAHVVELPLTPYVRYELAMYRENADAGEGVMIAERAAHPELDRLRRDFCLVDAETDHAVVVWYDYDPDGHLIGYRATDDARTIQECRRQRDLAIRHAVHLNHFLASLGTSRQ